MLAKNPRPCLPRPAGEPPSGPGWVHEIKHDGFRIMALRSEDRVRLFTRNGYDFAARFPKIVAAVEALPVRSCLIDGEAIVVNADGLSVFDLLRHRHHDDAAILCAFDLIELNGENLKWSTLENRKGCWLMYSKARLMELHSTLTSTAKVRLSSSMPACWATRGSYPSA
jgi:bifunctional non-homologous end joining protein LigD